MILNEVLSIPIYYIYICIYMFTLPKPPVPITSIKRNEFVEMCCCCCSISMHVCISGDV